MFAVKFVCFFSATNNNITAYQIIMNNEKIMLYYLSKWKKGVGLNLGIV